MARAKRNKAAREAFDRRIAESYALHEDGEISTEQLLSRVCDDCGCSVDRVVDGLIRVGVFTPEKGPVHANIAAYEKEWEDD